MPKEINSDLLRGNINTIILSALYSGDRYGYDIVSEIEKKSHGQFSIKQPTLYSCLKRLEALGYVQSYWGEQSNGGRRKYFSLTDLGREVFKQSQDDYEYSRTVIDKLISENKYDLGDDVIVSSVENDSQSNADNASSSDNATSEPSSSDTVNNDIPSDIVTDNEKTDVNNIPSQLSIDDVAQNLPSDDSVTIEIASSEAEKNEDDEEITGDGGRFLPPEFGRQNYSSDNNEFVPYTTSGNEKIGGESAKNGDISWFDAGIAAKNDDKVEVVDNGQDLSDIFSRNSTENSYFSDMKSGDVNKSNNIFSPSARNDDIDSIASSLSFGDNYSESDYPYADTSDSAATLIEAELSPLKQDNEFIKYHDGDAAQLADAAAQAEIESSNTSANDYQNVLTDIIDKFGSSNSEITKTDIQNNALELNDRVSIRAFGNIVESARELGEEVVVRTNDNSAKHRYSVKYYYNDSLLRLAISGILFVLMLIESLVTLVVCRNGVGAQGNYDYVAFVLAILASLAVPVVAAVRYYGNPHSKKRIENNMPESLWYKLVVMVLICALSFGLNLCLGMPLNSTFVDFTVPLFLPMILSTNLPLSYLLFRLLYKKKYFVAKD